MTPENETKRNKCEIKVEGIPCLWRDENTGRCTDPFGCLPMVKTPTKQGKEFLGTLPDNPDHLGWTGHY